MLQFLDLPLDILPLLLSQITLPQHLASIALVNKVFYEYTVPHLYYKIAVYAWYKNAKVKVR
jgi:hypothetical protein